MLPAGWPQATWLRWKSRRKRRSGGDSLCWAQTLVSLPNSRTEVGGSRGCPAAAELQYSQPGRVRAEAGNGAGVVLQGLWIRLGWFFWWSHSQATDTWTIRNGLLLWEGRLENLVPLRQNLLQRTSLGPKYGLPDYGVGAGRRKCCLKLIQEALLREKGPSFVNRCWLPCCSWESFQNFLLTV